VIVTWRTAAPARRMLFSAIGLRTRHEDLGAARRIPAFATRQGHGERRFRVRLTRARSARWVELRAFARDRPRRRSRIVVPISG